MATCSYRIAQAGFYYNQFFDRKVNSGLAESKLSKAVQPRFEIFPAVPTKRFIHLEISSIEKRILIIGDGVH